MRHMSSCKQIIASSIFKWKNINDNIDRSNTDETKNKIPRFLYFAFSQRLLIEIENSQYLTRANDFIFRSNYRSKLTEGRVVFARE